MKECTKEKRVRSSMKTMAQAIAYAKEEEAIRSLKAEKKKQVECKEIRSIRLKGFRTFLEKYYLMCGAEDVLIMIKSLNFTSHTTRENFCNRRGLCTGPAYEGRVVFHATSCNR